MKISIKQLITIVIVTTTAHISYAKAVKIKAPKSLAATCEFQLPESESDIGFSKFTFEAQLQKIKPKILTYTGNATYTGTDKAGNPTVIKKTIGFVIVRKTTTAEWSLIGMAFTEKWTYLRMILDIQGLPTAADVGKDLTGESEYFMIFRNGQGHEIGRVSMELGTSKCVFSAIKY